MNFQLGIGETLIEIKKRDIENPEVEHLGIFVDGNLKYHTTISKDGEILEVDFAGFLEILIESGIQNLENALEIHDVLTKKLKDISIAISHNFT